MGLIVQAVSRFSRYAINTTGLSQTAFFERLFESFERVFESFERVFESFERVFRSLERVFESLSCFYSVCRGYKTVLRIDKRV